MTKWDIYKSHYVGIGKDLQEMPSDQWALQPLDWENLFHMTPIERWLWEEMRNARMVMYPQYPIGGMFIDFANPKAKVAIECDGAAYHTDKAKDEARDSWLRQRGWSVYRFTGSECAQESNFDTGEATYAQQMLDLICQWHKVRRPVTQSGWLSIGLKPGQGATA